MKLKTWGLFGEGRRLVSSGWLRGWFPNRLGVQDTADLSKGQRNNKRKSEAHTQKHWEKNEKPCGPLARQNKSLDLKAVECKRESTREEEEIAEKDRNRADQARRRSKESQQK